MPALDFIQFVFKQIIIMLQVLVLHIAHGNSRYLLLILFKLYTLKSYFL